ncbi:MAG: alpha/beta fold hydrolase [Motiliproteus sp.]
MMSTLIKLLAVFLLLYALIASLVFLFQERLIFHPQTLDASDRARFQSYQVSFENEGHLLQGWYVPAKQPEQPQQSNPGPLTIYYGGNGEEVSWNIPYFQQHLDSSFLFLNYRGYGDSSGTPSESTLKSDALAAFDHFKSVQDPSQIILFGRSLGSGVAAYVASQRPVDAVVLVTPFDSLTAVASLHYPLLPVRWLLKHRFNSVALAPQINTPLLSLLAGRDQVVPHEHGQELEKNWQGVVLSLSFPRANHLTIADEEGYWPAIKEFIENQ